MNYVFGFLVYDAKRSFKAGLWVFLLLSIWSIADPDTRHFYIYKNSILFFILTFFTAQAFSFLGRCILWVLFLIFGMKYNLAAIFTKRFEVDLYNDYTAKNR